VAFIFSCVRKNNLRSTTLHQCVSNFVR
jgi:hypothetical protein